MSKKGEQQSTLCYNFNHYKTNKYEIKKHKMAYRPIILSKNKDKNTLIYHNTILQ